MRRNLIYHANVPTNDSIAITTLDRQKLTSHVESVSKDGLSIQCDRTTLEQLHPNTMDIAPKQSVLCEVQFTLSDNQEESDPITATSEVFSIRRLSRDSFQVCMRFKDISDDHFERVANYVNGIHNLRTERVARVA